MKQSCMHFQNEKQAFSTKNSGIQVIKSQSKSMVATNQMDKLQARIRMKTVKEGLPSLINVALVMMMKMMMMRQTLVVSVSKYSSHNKNRQHLNNLNNLIHSKLCLENKMSAYMILWWIQAFFFYFTLKMYAFQTFRFFV